MIESHERVEQFKQEIADMKVRDPATGRDRVWLRRRHRADGRRPRASRSSRTSCRTARRTRSRRTTRSCSRIGGITARGRRRGAVPALLARRLPPVLARPARLRAAGADRPHRREARPLGGGDLRVTASSAADRLVEHLGALAEREPHERPARVLVVVEDDVRNRDHAAAFRERATERQPVRPPPATNVGRDEVGARPEGRP